MKTSNGPERWRIRYILLATCAAVLALAFTVALLQPALADNLTPPSVPGDLVVGAGNKLFLIGHAAGTQNYICLPSGSGFAWTFYGPQATLFDEKNEQIVTHFLSPNPEEDGEARATWQDSRDTSAVWARAIKSVSVDPNAIPWLLLVKVGTAEGPTGGDRLAGTTFIQRINTSGGTAPTTGCSGPTDIGKKAFVSYAADYYFYKHSGQ